MGRIIKLVVSLWEYISKMALTAWMRMTPPPLLILPVANDHPIVQTLETLDLVKMVLIVPFSAIPALLISDIPAAGRPHHQLMVFALMAAFSILWNGILLGTIFPRFGSILQLLGISLLLFLSFGVVATFLTGGFSLACWLSGALCVMVFIYVAVKPQAADPRGEVN